MKKEFAEGLSRALKTTTTNKTFKDIIIENQCYVSHLLFFYDILVSCDGSKCMVYNLKDIVDRFFISIGMVINSSKSLIITWGLF
jgi:hypothetical protein